jgi:NAD(P)H-dependent FMN reductase
MTDNGTQTKPELLIVIASVRDGRKGTIIGDWIADAAKTHGAFDVKVADLKQIDLPLMTEPNHPRLKQYTQPKTWEWSRTVDSADAFVFVMPEYNFGAIAPLINALDYLAEEWAYKPVGLVTYGGVSGGLRAAQDIKPRITTMNMMPIKQSVTIPFFTEHIDTETGTFTPNDLHRISATDMLDELVKWDAAMRTIRATNG